MTNGADITAKDNSGNTALHLTFSVWSSVFSSGHPDSGGPETWFNKSLKVARWLLDHGADLNAVNLQGETALHLSIGIGNTSLTRLLLARGADVTLRDRDRAAPLTLATQSDY